MLLLLRGQLWQTGALWKPYQLYHSSPNSKCEKCQLVQLLTYPHMCNFWLKVEHCDIISWTLQLNILTIQWSYGYRPICSLEDFIMTLLGLLCWRCLRHTVFRSAVHMCVCESVVDVGLCDNFSNGRWILIKSCLVIVHEKVRVQHRHQNWHSVLPLFILWMLDSLENSIVLKPL